MSRPIEIHPADPAARRRALLAVAAIAAAGICGYFVLQDWLANLRAGDPDHAREGIRSALIWGTWTVALPVVGFAVHLWWFGHRVRISERFPPPGAKLVRDTPVVTGPAARTRAAALQLLAVFLCVFTVGLLLAAYRLGALLDQADSPTGNPMSAVADSADPIAVAAREK